MSTTFANSIDSMPIYADRAENDKDGNRIDTTYAKLDDIPSVPVTDVEVNGTSVVSGGVAAVTVPTATSDLTNDSGFITLSDVPAQVNADWNSSSGASEILNKPTIPSGTQLVPAATSADADKVLKVNASGEPEWATGGGGSQVQSDWTEDDSTEPSFIQNKPVPKTLVAGTGITITESSTELTVASTNQLYNAGTGLTLNNATFAVDTSVVATQSDLSGYATLNDLPTIDQIYDASSVNAQSGVAVASGISDALAALPTNLTSAQIQALKEALGVDETVLWEGTITPSGNSNLNTVITLSESILNFERIEVYATGRLNYLTWHPFDGNGLVAYQGLCENDSNAVTLAAAIIQESNKSTIRYRSGYGSTYQSAYRGEFWGYGTPYKVVGIHRIASN